MNGNPKPKPNQHLKFQRHSEPSWEGSSRASAARLRQRMRLTRCTPLGVAHSEVKAIGLGFAGLLGAENLLSFFQEQGFRSAF